jgi:hypothetical protein
MTLLLMAVYRLLYVQMPFRYARHATETLYHWLVALSWLLVISYGSFPLYYNDFNPKVRRCIPPMFFSTQHDRK